VVVGVLVMEFFRNVSAEIVHACSGDNTNSSTKITHMIRSFIRSIITSNKFPVLKSIIVNYDDFIVEKVYFEELCLSSVKIARLKDEAIVQNIKRCLEAIRLINMVVRRIFELKSEAFNIHQIEHIESLQQLWHFLKSSERLKLGVYHESSSTTTNVSITAPPIVSRNHPSSQFYGTRSLSTSTHLQSVQVSQVTTMVNVDGDWMELGFQGSDPSTDFRGMGILGLTQLLYFSQYKTVKARAILNDFSTKPTTGDSSTNGCYFPFAIIGINITRFLLEIVEEKRVHDILIEHLGHTVCLNTQAYHILPSDDEVCMEFGMKIIHEVYCTIFEEFYTEYVRVQPQTIMFFNMIFDNVKESIRKKYQPINLK
jgi:hypothetical protein